ncbi:DUF1592 domain-containing protein, partial [Enterococcus sp. S171_ASV_20]|uniref:DUF1592 domain-containing protein n=1 Tax=Enterococcus sp. S171_ASV_20 TaxID=2847005 RepID=UPI001C0F5BFE
QLLNDMIRETEMFFDDMIKGDRSVMTLIDGQYSFLNERLASLYALEGVKGEEFRRVDLKNTGRSGILTQPAILTLTS